MIYLYDKAIVDDLQKCFNSANINSVVKVVAPENVVELVAQLREDEVQLPVVALQRNEPVSIDDSQMNFTRKQFGIETVFDPQTNESYYEKVLPLKLSYTLSVIASNVADSDELIRELVFKYNSMYFLTITLPYECHRQVRFGISVDTDIHTDSSSSEYMHEGKLYESTLQLNCQGCVLVSYTPVKLKRIDTKLDYE